MKKVLAAVTLLAIGFSASAKKWTNFPGIGVRIPTDTEVSADKTFAGKDDFEFNTQVGFDVSYVGVHENGFAVKAAVDIDYTKSNLKDSDGDDLSGVNTSFYAGVGYAPIFNEKLFIGAFLTIGADYDLVIHEIEKPIKATYKYSYTALTLGGNLTAIFTPVKSFSFYASVNAGVNLPGEFKSEIEISSDTTTKTVESKAAFKLIPAVGVCWKF